MNRMQEVLKSIAAAQEIASMNLDEVPYSVKTGWTMRIEAAKGEVALLTQEYRNLLSEVIPRKVFLLGSNEAVKEFSAVMNSLGIDGLFVDASALYRRLTDRAFPTLGTRGEFAWTQARAINNELYEIEIEMGLDKVEQINLQELPAIYTAEDLLVHVRRMVRETNKDVLNIKSLESRIVKQAMSLEVTGPINLFIRGAEKEELQVLSADLMGGEPLHIRVTENMDEKAIKRALETSGLYSNVEGVTVDETQSVAEVETKKRTRKLKEPTNVP